MSVSLSLSGFGGARTLENLSESSGGSCGNDTHLAEQVSLTQPATHASPAHFYTFQLEVFSGVELVSRATYIIRKRRNWETRQRKSKAYKRAEGEAKRELLAQPEISYEAAQQILRSQATRTDDNFPGIIHVRHQLALPLPWPHRCVCCANSVGTLRLLKSLCDGTGESRQKARRKLERGLMPNEQVTTDASAHLNCCAIFLTRCWMFRLTAHCQSH